jgi:hypothetical protein
MRFATRSLFILLVGLGTHATHAGESPIGAARAHFHANRVFVGSRPVAMKYAAQIAKTIQGRDAQTKTISFIHGIRRQAKKLLSETQATEWERLLAARQSQIQRLHDERNVLRGVFFAGAWELPALDGAEREAKRGELEDWLSVWLDTTLHERIANHRLCRDAWGILTPQQRQNLAAGEWDVHVKKSTGHKRDYFGDKIVSRPLGKPDRPEAFQKLSIALEAKHDAIQSELLETERRWRILTLQIPSVPDELLVAEWQRTAAALGNFFLSQVRAIDDLTHAGYDLRIQIVKDKVRSQTSRERSDLEKRVRDKLPAGLTLLSRIRSAEQAAESTLK